MKIVLVKKSNEMDWFNIVRAEHDGREWIEEVSRNCSRFMMSERLSPEACIEGDKFEIQSLVNAIIRRGQIRHKRCAVEFEAGGFYFSSPKNSQNRVFISIEEADEFALQAMEELEHSVMRKAGLL